MLYFQWTSGRVYQAMHTTGAVDKYYVIKRLTTYLACLFYHWFFYPVAASEVIAFY